MVCSASALNEIQPQSAISSVDWMLFGREKPEGQNASPVGRCPILRPSPTRSGFVLSCQEGFQARAHAAGALGTGDTAFIANSHHRQYRWALYTWGGPLRSQVTEISWLGFVWKWWRETSTTRRGFLTPYMQGAQDGHLRGAQSQLPSSLQHRWSYAPGWQRLSNFKTAKIRCHESLGLHLQW